MLIKAQAVVVSELNGWLAFKDTQAWVHVIECVIKAHGHCKLTN